MDNTIQMNLFEYFIDEEKFSIQDATNLVKNIKNMQVNNESIRARIYEGVEKGIFTKISRGVYKVTNNIRREIRMRGKNRSAKRRDIYKNFSEVWTFAMKLRCNYDSCIVMSTNS